MASELLISSRIIECGKHSGELQTMYPDDLITSDVRDHLENVIENAQFQVDFSIEVHTKIYINKALTKRTDLPDAARDNFDLSDIEDKHVQDLNILGN
jgi:hypothetical protein